MIKRLQRLKSKRGYTMLELIIAISILAIMVGTITANTSSRQNRIREANSTAKDFYTTIQTEFTRFQMYDGPLTISLQKRYNEAGPSSVLGTGNRQYGGLMWFPAVGGNYPVLNDMTKMAKVHVTGDVMEWRKDARPTMAGLTIEVHVINNKIQSVDWDYSTSRLFQKDIDETKSELSAVLELELDKRMEYKDGYYYARVVYFNSKTMSNPDISAAECRAEPVRVLWAAYCRKQINADPATYTFRTYYTSNSGEILGLVGGNILVNDEDLGAPGTSLLTVMDQSAMV